MNVWLAFAWAEHVHHKLARQWFSRLGTGEAVFCRMTQIGFLRLLTNRQIMGANVLSQGVAWHMYDEFMKDVRIEFAQEPQYIEGAFRTFSGGPLSSPKLWNDAYLAAFATAAGLSIASFDSGFRKYPGLDFHPIGE